MTTTPDEAQPETCDAGHDLGPVVQAYATLTDRLGALDMNGVIGELGCLGVKVAQRLDDRLSASDKLGVTALVGLIQRLDGDLVSEEHLAPVDGAPTGVVCTCHDGGTPIVHLINDVVTAMDDHAELHRDDQPTPGNYL